MPMEILVSPHPYRILLASLLALLGWVPEASSDPGARVLIVTGEDYPGHHWRETAPVLRKLIAADRRLEVDVVEDLELLRPEKLQAYQAVVMHFKNYDPEVPGRAGFDALRSFVEKGGGLVLVHFSCGAFQEFKAEFVHLAGRVWNPELRGHDPHGKFRVEIAGEKHPVTRGMKSFETTDELYTCLDGDAEIEVLAQARSKVDGKLYPMAFTLACGKGRVFHTVLGHDVPALSTSGTAELIRRATAWAAGLKALPQRRRVTL